MENGRDPSVCASNFGTCHFPLFGMQVFRSASARVRPTNARQMATKKKNAEPTNPYQSWANVEHVYTAAFTDDIYTACIVRNELYARSWLVRAPYARYQHEYLTMLFHE